jgi:hypothetical protein
LRETTTQDLTSSLDLGSPSEVHDKRTSAKKLADDIGDRDCKGPLRSENSQCWPPLDFYKHFQHGIDFLISNATHVLKKVILLRVNIPSALTLP